MANSQVYRFSDVLQVDCQRKGSMVKSTILVEWYVHPKENVNHRSSMELSGDSSTSLGKV
jgi:hypothetical protein